MLIRPGRRIEVLVSVSDEEQERRVQTRAADPKRRWKLSPMDIESRDRWVDYSRAKDAMFEYTDTKDCPSFVVDSDDKKRARPNCISHTLERIRYEDVLPPPIKRSPRAEQGDYIRPPTRHTSSVVARHSLEVLNATNSTDGDVRVTAVAAGQRLRHPRRTAEPIFTDMFAKPNSDAIAGDRR